MIRIKIVDTKEEIKVEENNVNVAEPMNKAEEQGKSLPTEISVWTKVKNFLFHEIKLELTPKQEKVFQEVHDFWHQEITGQDVNDFLFHEITAEGVKKFWFKKIDITL